MAAEFTVGQQVVWLRWPRHNRSGYFQRVNGTVLELKRRQSGSTRVKIEVADSLGNSYNRWVETTYLMSRERYEANIKPGEHIHGDGFYTAEEKKYRDY